MLLDAVDAPLGDLMDRRPGRLIRTVLVFEVQRVRLLLAELGLGSGVLDCQGPLSKTRTSVMRRAGSQSVMSMALLPWSKLMLTASGRLS